MTHPWPEGRLTSLQKRDIRLKRPLYRGPRVFCMITRGEYGLDGPGAGLVDGIDVVARADRRLGFVDLTEQLEDAVETAGIWEGACLAFCRHTTAALIIN